MLQTYEAVLQPNGSLQFLDLPWMPTLAPRCVLVTFTDELTVADTALSAPPCQYDLRHLPLINQ